MLLAALELHRHRPPDMAFFPGWSYHERHILGAGEQITVLVAPEVSIRLDTLLPPP
jgi:hypothetical protein